MDLGLLVALLFFGFIATEGFVEYFFGTLFEKFPKITPYAWTLKYISLLAGIGLAFAYNLDLVARVFTLASPGMPWLGTLITGVVMGRGANFVSEVWDKYLS